MKVFNFPCHPRVQKCQKVQIYVFISKTVQCVWDMVMRNAVMSANTEPLDGNAMSMSNKYEYHGYYKYFGLRLREIEAQST